MRIKLILAADPGDSMKDKNPFKPLSLLLLAAAAPAHEYELVDMLDAHSLDYNSTPDLVGISVRRSAEETAFRVADKFKEHGVKVVMGGPQVSANPFESLSHADAVVVGEGEELWVKLLDDIQKGELKDFYVSAPGKFEAAGHSVYQPGQLPSLDKIPKVNRKLFKKKYDFELVFASRGCAINCDFCSVTRLFGSKYRLRPVEDVVEEIAGFKGYYYLIDDTVFGRHNTYDYYLGLYDKIAALKKINYWTGQANLDAASNDKGREVIKKAAKSGLIYAAIGMESINKTVLQKSGSYAKMGMSKSVDMLEKMKENIRFIQNQGILISAWFVIGYEDDDLETYYETLKFCLEMNVLPVFTPVHAMPGTDLYDRLLKEGKLQDNSINVTNVPHKNITNQQVIEALQYANKKGFNFITNLKRSYFYFNILRRQKGNTVNDIIHKTLFALIVQWRFGKITKRETKILSDKIALRKQ
jgi:radical SAM superfamily enzyme YgiQ (UPF0313 family)